MKPPLEGGGEKGPTKCQEMVGSPSKIEKEEGNIIFSLGVIFSLGLIKGEMKNLLD
jgi:hypothetical protein